MPLRALPFAALALAACTGEPPEQEEYVPVKGPVLEHTPPTGAFVAGEDVPLEVIATDDDGVAEVTAFFRVQGSTYWDNVALEPGDGDAWVADVGPLYSPGIEYYFEAADGNSAARAYTSLPPQGPLDPYSLAVEAAAIRPPWSEDFELEEGETSLFTMNWFTPSEAFDSYTWQHTASRGYSDSSSAFHSRVPAEVGDVRDWLISPALDFSNVEEAMLTWYEYGSGTPAMGTHSLMISTGSRDIADGDFEPIVAELEAPPEAAWGRSAAIDLTPWAGAREVYLAWVYDGQMDDWYIDDIVVGDLKADVTASVAWDPDPMHPGDTATVTVTFDNSTVAPATGLEATLSLPDGGGTVVEPTLPVPDLAGEGTTSVDFTVELDPDLHDNQYLPAHVSLTDGTDTWEFDLQVTIGLPSQAALTLELATAGSLNVLFGVGDPDAPTAAVTAFSGTADAGTQTLVADVTDLYDLLPPAPGPQRWFAQVTGGSGSPVTDFTVTYGGETTAATVLPTLGAITTLWLPEPPDPVLVSSSPSSASPGDTDLAFAFTVRNDGAVTAGPVTADLVSLSPEVSVTGGLGLEITTEPWAGGTTRSISGPRVTIGPDHNQSQPARFELTLTDGVESWTEELSVAVPWPVLQIVSTVVDDSGGDGVLDPDETATLTFDIANTGDLGTFGRLDATLSVAGTSMATATLTDPDGTFFSISAGGTRDEDFEVEVTGGSEGDVLDLELALDDGTASYLLTTSITLGTPPWQAITPFNDTLGDNLDDYGFDLQNVWYRVDGDTVDMLVTSAIPYDPTNVFVEAWGISSGAQWTFYRWVAQGGVGEVYGYQDGGFQPIADLTITEVSSTELMLSFETTDLGLVLDRFDIGFAAGWCGPPEYFCDHFPNGWGWPYDGTTFDPGDWYSVSW